MRQISDQQYTQFTPEERARLTMAALARNDEAEASRLAETCPKFRYRIPDLEYTERVNSILLISATFFERCIRHYNMIKKSELLTRQIENEIMDDEDRNFPELVQKTRKAISIANEARKFHLLYLMAAFKGFEKFCVKVGFEYEDVLQTIPIKESCPDIDLLLSGCENSNAELIEVFCEKFCGYWNF